MAETAQDIVCCTPIPKKVASRLVRIESKLTNYMMREDTERDLNGQMRVRVRQLAKDLNDMQAKLDRLLTAFEQFKREWDEEGEMDEYDY